MLGKKCVFYRLGIFVSLCLVLAGCGGASGGAGGGSGAISVAVTSSANTVDGADTVTLTAKVANDHNSQGVTWSVSGGGALSNTTATSAAFTAPSATSSAQTITVTATSVANESETGSVTLTVAAKPAITTAGTALASQVGAAYNVTLEVSGGVGPYLWTATGTLPSCLALNTATGAITGTVTAACAGNYSPTFTVTDSGSPTKLTATQQLDFTIAAAPTITLPGTITAQATAGVAYSASVAAAGGAGPLTYKFTSGFPPAGLALNVNTGVIFGTPVSTGTANFSVSASDGFGDTPASQSYTITVNPGAATHFFVAPTSGVSIVAGGTVAFQVTALDVDGNVATGYAGTVRFTSSDAQAVLPWNAALAGGAGSFSATLKTGGSATVTVTDTAVGSITGTSGAITVNAGTATKLVISAPATAAAGTPVNVMLTAQDAYGNTATGYSGTVHVTSTDGSAALPSDSTLLNGVWTFPATLKTAGTQTLTATDTLTSTLSGTSGAITVSAGAASRLVLSALPGVVTAGGVVGVQVTAQDTYGNPATGYAGTVRFTSTDSAAVLPANTTLSNGAGHFGVTLRTAGSQTITAIDTVTGTIAGVTGAVTVNPAALNKLAITAPSTATAGMAFGVTVAAEDFYGNAVTTYSGTVHFTSTDGSASLPADMLLLNGTGNFQATLKTAGTETITANDTLNAGLTGSSPGITVSAGAASMLSVSFPPGTVTAGLPYNVSVTAKDAYGNIAIGYTGTIGVTSSDSQAVLPAAGPLSNGSGTFPVTLKTSGAQTISVADTVNPTLNASGSIPVSAAAATHLNVVVTSGSTVTAGAASSITVTALDAYGNVATGYAGTVHFTSTDSAATLPADSAPAGGSGIFSATLKTVGAQTITATDTTKATIIGTTNGITVNASAATSLVVSAPPAATNGVAFNFTVTAKDQYGNTATGFSGYIAFGSSDHAALLPGNSYLTNGTKVFSITLNTSGAQNITATDTLNGSINGTSGAINVSTALIVATTTLAAGDASASYSQTLAASGGSESGYTWAATGGNLSTFGLTLSSAGVVSGTPTQSGTVSFTAKVTDSGSDTATQTVSITFYSALSLPASNSLPQGYTNVNYTGGIAGSGGSGSLSIAITAALSPANGTLAASASGSSVSITGTPTTVTTESIGVELTDSTTGNSITQSYSMSVTTPTTPSLPAANPVSLPSGTVSQSYAGSISASGGVGPNYTWTVNGTTIPTNGSAISIGNGLQVTNDGSKVLQVSGTPTTVENSPALTFSAQIKDNASGLTSSNVLYSIAVNPSGGTISGQVLLSNSCGVVTPPTFQVTINTSPAQSVQTDSSGNFSFTGIATGTYTLTPSLYNAPSGAETLFSPSSIANVSVTYGSSLSETFAADVAYTVSGSISYGGSQNGQVYIDLYNSSCSNPGEPGTSIAEAQLTSGGAYTIRGVPPGSYTAYAWMDSTGVTSGTNYPGAQGALNSNDPTGSNNLTVSTDNVTTDLTLVDQSHATPPNNPQFAVVPNASGALLLYNPPTASAPNGGIEEAANEYTVQWAVADQTDSAGSYCALSGGAGSAFATVAGTHTFYPVGATAATLWFLNNTSMGANTFTSGQTYCFQAQAVNTLASPTSSGWWTPTDSDNNAQGYTLATTPCNGSCTTVSGTVTIPAGVTIASGAPLYVGFIQQGGAGQGPSALYVQEIASPAAGANNFSMTVPDGAGYVEIGIVDQNNDGQIDVGDVTNVRGSRPSGITISGGSTSVDTTLPGANSAATVQTQYLSCGTSCGGYDLDMQLTQENKLPVAVTLTSGPNVLLPVDLGLCAGCGNNGEYALPSSLLSGATPHVGDEYDFTVTYSDGTQDTGTAVNGKVTAFGNTGAVAGASDTLTSMSPALSSLTLQPDFSWTFPANASDYLYSFSLEDCSTGCSQVWTIPDFTYAETGSGMTGSVLWNVDPTGNGGSPSVSNLTNGDQYLWTVTVQDSKGNQAQSGASFTAQ